MGKSLGQKTRVSIVICYWKKVGKRLLTDEDGPTAVEYAVMLALIIGVAVSAVQSMATATGDSFDTSSNAIEGALGP